MGIKRTAHAAILLGTLAFGAAAQNASAAPWVQRSVRSKTLGPRKIVVATPDGYPRDTRRYPVMIVLDADDQPQFRLAVAQAGYLADNTAGTVPPVIVVGILNGPDRIHDMSPPATGATAAEFATAGGAPVFADFILNEVLPMVRAQYRTLPMTILTGHSIGGLFALDVAAHRPGAFQSIIAISPSLWWNDSSLVVRYADAIAASPARLRLFASSGALEPNIDITTRRFAQRLDSAKHEAVGFSYRSYPNDTHALTPLSLADGLRFTFEPVSIRRLPISNLSQGTDSATVVRSLQESEAIYADGARALLLPERLPEGLVNQAGNFALRTLKQPAFAIWIFNHNAALHPESVNLHASLAEAYVAEGDTAAAISDLRRAMDVAASMCQEVPKGMRDMLAELSHKTRAAPPNANPRSARCRLVRAP